MDDKIQICSLLEKEVVDTLVMQRKDMCERPDLALDAIWHRSEQALMGKVSVKKIVYIDEDQDSCTLTAPSISDALDLCKDDVMLLYLIPEASEVANVSKVVENLMDDLLKRVKGLNLQRVWERLGEAGLELLAELQPQWQDDWAKLIQPLNAMASSCRVDLREVLQLTVEIYQKMDGPLQEKVRAFTLQTLERVVKDR